MERWLDYDGIRVLDIESEAPYDWSNKDADFLRISLPSSHANMQEMLSRGFTFGDRMLRVKIMLNRVKIDFSSLVRTQPELTRERKEDILAIACESFPTDRRFHLAPDYDAALAQKVLECWIRELDQCFVCDVKGEAAGFLALKEIDDFTVSIHLAAVRERWRAAGVAMSLYAAAIQWAKMQGYTTVEGYISAANTSVLNLYAFMGGGFYCSSDVFLKER